jgi:hypothetical protein
LLDQRAVSTKVKAISLDLQDVAMEFMGNGMDR